jgi:uncharacterized protein (TIGR02300 family)
MPELGNKFECANCGTRFYDLGKPEPICPKCGTNLKEAASQEANSEKQPSRRRTKAKAVEPKATDPAEVEGETFEGDLEEEEAEIEDSPPNQEGTDGS